MKTCIIVLLLIFYTEASVIAQQKIVITPGIKSGLDALTVQDVPPHAPGVAVGIVQDGTIIYENCAGLRDLEDSSDINRFTRFNIASNGKQFTALAIAKLVGEGRLELNQDIRKYFPGMFLSVRQPITVANLLTHTSGIRDVYDLWALQNITWWKNTFSNAQVLQLLQKQEELNFLPGTRYLYSNSNYMLLAELVSKVSGSSFVNYTSELFKTLGMPDTRFKPDHQAIKGPIAKPYFNFDTWTGYKWTWNAVGDGNLFTTLADQLQWEKILQQQKTGMFSEELLAKSQQRIPGFAQIDYGYGLEFGTYKNIPCIFHEGATGAWKATTIRFPGRRLAIVTMCNTGKAIPSMQSRQMADLLLGITADLKSYLTAPPIAGSFIPTDSLPGFYQDENNFTFQIEKRDTTLFLLRNGRNDTKLERESVNVFHQWNDKAFKQEFTRNSKGQMQVTAYYSTHAPYILTRENIDWTGFAFTAPEGHYLNAETGVELSITYLSGKNYSIRFGDQARKALLISPGKMLADNYTIHFFPGSQVETLFLDGERVKNIRFARR